MSPLLKIQDPQEPGEGQVCFPTEGLWVRSWHGGGTVLAGTGESSRPSDPVQTGHPPSQALTCSPLGTSASHSGQPRLPLRVPHHRPSRLAGQPGAQPDSGHLNLDPPRSQQKQLSVATGRDSV